MQMDRPEAAVKIAGVLGLVGVAIALAINGVPDDVVVLLVGAILTVAAPDVAKELDWGPF